ncbi:hypothetical protein CCO03_17090 [Comamonas serinivorans]|uniref:Uncharacterized protein n=1 Tax=Comamonas serinivorans TaxID=1082851 RepID=A0A1Y0ESE0_9BURK|nr:hypothetical protein [Comamonas serinivorans]ARU06162.1 hypothetical protein CCO03_17090 [Comamonas serinivorans]
MTAIPFSRALIGGKKNSKLEARVSDELKEAARRRWMDAGFSSESEYIEHVVSIDVFGKEHVRSLILQRLDRVGGVSDNAQRGA